MWIERGGLPVELMLCVTKAMRFLTKELYLELTLWPPEPKNFMWTKAVNSRTKELYVEPTPASCT